MTRPAHMNKHWRQIEDHEVDFVNPSQSKYPPSLVRNFPTGNGDRWFVWDENYDATTDPA